MLMVVTSDYGAWVPLVPDERRRQPRRSGLIVFNATGWTALFALGSFASVLASLVLPLPVALALGLASSSAAYTAEWLMTRRAMNQRPGGPRPPGGGPSGVREPRPPASPLPTLDASRPTPQ